METAEASLSFLRIDFAENPTPLIIAGSQTRRLAAIQFRFPFPRRSELFAKTPKLPHPCGHALQAKYFPSDVDEFELLIVFREFHDESVRYRRNCVFVGQRQCSGTTASSIAAAPGSYRPKDKSWGRSHVPRDQRGQFAQANVHDQIAMAKTRIAKR